MPLYNKSWTFRGASFHLKEQNSKFSKNAISSSGPHFERTSARIRLPDDCTVGFIVEKMLGVAMVHCPLFHSHLENLLLISQRSLPQQVRRHTIPAERAETDSVAPSLIAARICICSLQVTLSYGMFENKMNSIEVKGSFSKEEDPSRLVSPSIHLQMRKICEQCPTV